MNQIFTCGDRAQDLIDWATRIEAVGNAIEAIGAEDGIWCIPILGGVIYDYASAMKTVLNAYYPEMVKVVGDFEFPALVEIEDNYERLEWLEDKGNHQLANDLINETLEKVQKFKKSISSIFDIEEGLKKRINIKEKGLEKKAS